MILKEILNLFREHHILLNYHSTEEDLELKGKICTDSREVKAGDIFICITGFNTDGHNFIDDVRKKNVALIVSERPLDDNLTYIQVTESRKAAALLAKLYYHNPSAQFRLIGITGTNGKTTTSILLYRALMELGYSCGWIGTLGYQINNQHYSSNHTTPDIIELNQIFARMVEKGVKYVSMEVSSHALALDRVYGIEFDYCLFTNLSREHLDFHQTMEEYGNAKKKLFERTTQHKAVGLINIDDNFGRKLFEELKSVNAYVYSIGNMDADFIIRTEHSHLPHRVTGNRFSLQTPDGMINIRTSLTGIFNMNNLAMCAASLNLMGFEARQIEQCLNIAQPVKGRFEPIPNERGIQVFVDYAHTPDAMENVLKACQDLEHKRILCLFGAGGNRDKGKRSLMLQTALHYANAVIITDDNPRFEDPDAIIRDIVSGTELWLPWWIIRNRKEAIHSILRLAQPGDIVLLCGKGHENYQEIEGVRYPFEDAVIASEFLHSEDTFQIESEELILPVDKLMLELLAKTPFPVDNKYKPPKTYHYLSTDSRTIVPNSIFFAITGLHFNGNDFLPQVLTDETILGIGTIANQGWDNYIQVTDPLSLLSALCRKYLQMFEVYKIALTGSTGKSSTKEILAQIFNSYAPTLKTQANENNMIGLCKTIPQIRPNHRYAVFELGTNAFGEIAALANVCNPNAAIIINVGPSHLEKLIDEEGVFREKTALFNRPLDIMLFDGDDPRFIIYADKGKSVGYSDTADFHITDLECNNETCKFKINGEPFSIPYSAPFLVKNASFAIAMGILKNIPLHLIKEAISKPVKLNLRLQIEKTDNYIIIADCYNANPISMQSAIEFWHKLEPEREHIAILGDMLELGIQAPMYHNMIGTILAEKGVDRLITVGNLSQYYHLSDSSLKSDHFNSVDELIQSGILKTLTPGAVILIKGSHSIQLEKVIPILRKGS
ncbi:MAG: UDP-N-acetylmuramoyl-L-alanyl-D-glutamate--2,6-diaminopimelate ligase [Candidatus Cloacimonetes bacterium]|nr:UDP-N-acetylmuramoyl-L-alanyl-D-glutamate--2,6-diaminopimelate ligase [Candidatus Cloacimonadota bacterium]